MSMDAYFQRLIIYESGITMNISNRQSVTVLSNLQFKLIFSVLKKCKNGYISPSDIITSSRMSLIIFSIEDLTHKKIESYPTIHINW